MNSFGQGSLGVLLAVFVFLVCLILFIGFSMAWAVLIIWALNVLGLHVAYGATEVLAVLILSGFTIRFG